MQILSRQKQQTLINLEYDQLINLNRSTSRINRLSKFIISYRTKFWKIMESEIRRIVKRSRKYYRNREKVDGKKEDKRNNWIS